VGVGSILIGPPTTDRPVPREESERRFPSRVRPGGRRAKDGGDDALAVISRFDGIDTEMVGRSADLRRSEVIDTAELNRFENSLDSGEIGGAELRASSAQLSHPERFNDRSYSTDELLEIDQSDGDLTEVEQVILADETVVWLETDDSETGLVHILKRHLNSLMRDTLIQHRTRPSSCK